MILPFTFFSTGRAEIVQNYFFILCSPETPRTNSDIFVHIMLDKYFSSTNIEYRSMSLNSWPESKERTEFMDINQIPVIFT